MNNKEGDVVVTPQKPVRIQRSRQHKNVSPNGLPIKYVGRPSKWGNPYVVAKGATDPIHQLDYRNHILDTFTLWEIKSELEGKNLACWCPPESKVCHADLLLELANQ